MTFENSNLRVELDVSPYGVSLTRIQDKVTGVQYLSGRTSLFEFAADDGTPYRSNDGMSLESVAERPGRRLTVTLLATGAPLRFTISLSTEPNDTAVIFGLRVQNLGGSRVFLRTVLPKLHGITTANPARSMVMVPKEIGSVGTLWSHEVTFGSPFNIGVGLPAETGVNSMEVASLYDPDGRGGIFFADLDGHLESGILPIHLTVMQQEVAGFWTAHLKPFQAVDAPRLAIGVHHSGDWHAAVDYYVAAHQSRWRFPDTPAWLKENPLYSFGGGGAGGIYLRYRPIPLESRIRKFDDLPVLLHDARRFGSDIVYLWDYWEAPRDGEYIDEWQEPYFNKGDYIPRRDGEFGGNEAFTRGIAKVHAEGGKVILYVEPFILYPTSILGRKKGALWASTNAFGNLFRDRANAEVYPGYLKMNAAFVPWQDEVVKIAQRLVGEYGADGIMLDSWGWQMNWEMQTVAEGLKYNSSEYSQAVLRLVDRVRAAVRAIKPDTVVISETTAGPIARHVDGGVSGDLYFLWERGANADRIVGSPVRYGMPNVNFFGNGRDLAELHQVFAAGHNLALCTPCWVDKNDADPRTGPDFMWAAQGHIKALVDARKRFKDALVYGRQRASVPSTSPDVAVYGYDGTSNAVLTAVNLHSEARVTAVTLGAGEAGTTWQDAFTGEAFRAEGRTLLVPVGPALDPSGIRILHRAAAGAAAAYPVMAYDPYVLRQPFGDLFASWTPYGGEWRVSGDQVLARTPRSVGGITFDTRTGANFSYEAGVALTSGGEAGLSFRLADAFRQVEDVTEIGEAYVKGYDVVLSLPEQRVKLAKRPYELLATVPAALAAGVPYRLTVLANGSRIQVFLNGRPVIDLFERSSASGRFGLVSNDAAVAFTGLMAAQWMPPFTPHHLYGDIRETWELLGSDLSPLGMPTTSEADAASSGRFNAFERGYIYWKESTGAHAVYGLIGAKWNALGRERVFGYPLTDELVAPDGAGRYNDFENGGSIYWHVGSPVAYEVHGAIAASWRARGGVRSPLGYPVSDELDAARGGRVSKFQYGSVFLTPWRETLAVFGRIGEKYEALGREAGFGYPVRDEGRTSDGGYLQDFENGGAIVLAPGAAAAHEIHGAIRAHWSHIGAERSPLGYPTSDEVSANGGRAQKFQWGFMMWSPESGAHEVHGVIGAKYADLRLERSWLGYPITDEMSTGGGEGRMNYFQHGMITWHPSTGVIVYYY